MAEILGCHSVGGTDRHLAALWRPLTAPGPSAGREQKILLLLRASSSGGEVDVTLSCQQVQDRMVTRVCKGTARRRVKAV